MAALLLQDVRETLFKFDNEFSMEFEKILNELMVGRDLLMKESAELKKLEKASKGIKKRGRPRIKPLESLVEEEENKVEGDDGASGRPRRKAAQKAVELSKDLHVNNKRTKRGAKRKNSTSSSAVEKPASKTVRKDKAGADVPAQLEQQDKLITNCHVVVEKLTFHQTITVQQLQSNSKPDGSSVASGSDKAENHNLNVNGSKEYEIKKCLKKSSSRGNDKTLEKRASGSQKQDELSHSKKRPFPDESPDEDGSPINSPSTVPEKRSKITILKEDSEVQNSSPEERCEEIHVAKPITKSSKVNQSKNNADITKRSPEEKYEEIHLAKATGQDSKANQTFVRKKDITIKRNRTDKEENNVEILSDEDVPQKKFAKSRIPKPKENMEILQSPPDENCEEISSIKAVSEEKPKTASPVSSEEITSSSPEKNDVIVKTTPEKGVARSIRAVSKENMEIVNKTPEGGSARMNVDNESSEKRITRSKMAKPKENKDIIWSPKDMNNEMALGKATLEKRVTRSKIAKPKENKEIEVRSPEDMNNEMVLDKATPEKRVTRSKMAKPKENKEIEVSPSDETDEETPEPVPKKASNLPKTMPKYKVKELFSPVFVGREHFLEKENNFSKTLKTAEKKHSKLTPLQVRNGFTITPASKTKFPTVSAVLSATKSKSVMDDVERRRKEEEAHRKRMKEEEALRKRNEMMKAKQEDIRRKNEEKMLKVAAMRKAVNKETTDRLVKMEKEKEERERMLKEQLEKKKEEEVAKKKILYETKALEAETRRQKEEAARQAKIKEMEEEKRREEELRLKQQEETERIRKQREEMRMKEAALMKVREIQKKKINMIQQDKDNYDINDILPGDDDSDMEDSQPKKEIPMWARKSEEKDRQEKIQSFVSIDVVAQFFSCPSQTPDLKEFFGKMTMKRVRTSSAVWLDTPPLSSR